MGLLDRLLGPPKLATRSGNWPASQVPGELYNLRTSGAGVDVSEEDALSLSAVFAGINLLARITAALPLSVYRRAGGRRGVAEAHPAQRLLHTEYNPEMTAVVGRRTDEFHRLLGGNSYAEIQWAGDGMPAALWPIEHWRVKPKRDGAGALYYLVDGRRRVAPRDMLHNTLTSADGVCGQSFLEYAVNSLGLGIAAQQFAERFFGNGARPGVLLVHDGSPDKKQRDEQRESWERLHQGPDRQHKTGVLWGGWKVSEYGGAFSPEQAQLLESRRFGVEEVARWLNVPPHILRDLSRSTNNNIEHQGIEFVQLTLGPTLCEREQEYDRKLLDPPDLYAKHNVTALLRGDSKARSEFLAKMWGSGFLSQNEVRELEDLNPIGPDGDTYFVPVNMQPLDRAIHPPAPAPVQAPAPPPGDGPTPAMRAALAALVADTFGRLLRKETNEGRRAARKPGEFLGWMDRFYADYQPTLALALAPVLAPVNAALGTAHQAAAVAGEHCRRSREALLELSGRATPAGLAAAVEREFAVWEPKRADDEAARIIGA